MEMRRNDPTKEKVKADSEQDDHNPVDIVLSY